MNGRDQQQYESILRFIRERRRSESEKREIYGYLLGSRGQGCANHAMLLIKLYANRTDFAELEAELDEVFQSHQREDAVKKNDRFLYISICATAVILLAFSLLSMFGFKVPTDQRHYPCILMGLCAAVIVFCGGGTATVSANLPEHAGAKIGIKLGGSVAAFAGVTYLFYRMTG